MAKPIHPARDIDDVVTGFKENGAEGLEWGGGAEIPSSDDVALQDDLDALELRVDAAEGDIDDLEAADVAIDGRLDDLEADVAALEAVSADARLDALEAADISLDGRLDTAEADINTLQDDLSDHLADLDNPHEVLMKQVAVAEFVNPTVNVDYDLVLTALGKVVNLSNDDDGTPLTVLVPTNADEAFPVGSSILFRQVDVGAYIFEGDVGVTLDAENDATMTNAQWAVAALLKVATNEWHVFGSLTAAP